LHTFSRTLIIKSHYTPVILGLYAHPKSSHPKPSPGRQILQLQLVFQCICSVPSSYFFELETVYTVNLDSTYFGLRFRILFVASCTTQYSATNVTMVPSCCS